jgi:thymidylate synthase/dihydrofolate reductase
MNKIELLMILSNDRKLIPITEWDDQLIAMFRKYTENHILVMGIQTFEELCVHNCLDEHVKILLFSKTRDKIFSSYDVEIFSDFYPLTTRMLFGQPTKVVGGSYLVNHFLKIAYTLHIYVCTWVVHGLYDVTIPQAFDLISWNVMGNITRLGYKKLYQKVNSCDRQYLDLCKQILESGDLKPDGTFSSFGKQIRLDISKNTPALLTTKHVPWKQCIEDLLLTLRGSSVFSRESMDRCMMPSVQFYVSSKDELSCHVYQHTCDVSKTLPLDMLSYSVLTHIVAKQCGYTANELIISFGNSFIKHQTSKTKTPLPGCKMVLGDLMYKTMDEICVDDFKLVGYFYHASTATSATASASPAKTDAALG